MKKKKYKYFHSLGDKLYGFYTVEEMCKWISDNIDNLPGWANFNKQMEEIEFFALFGRKMKEFYDEDSTNNK